MDSATGRDVVHLREGESRTLYANPEIPVLNDVTVDPDGHVIVGCLRFRPLAGEPPVAGEFIRLDNTAVISDVLWANGCAFSRDGLTFYGCEYQRGLVLAADRTSGMASKHEATQPATMNRQPSGHDSTPASDRASIRPLSRSPSCASMCG